MTVENLTTARFVLQCLLDELEAYDRCIPVARNVQVGDVADALLTVLNDRQLIRLTAPKSRSAPHRRRQPVSARRKVAEGKRRASRTA
jgi:tRNA C32,U32 (ribose-2'-O)-methylase TrmJ